MDDVFSLYMDLFQDIFFYPFAVLKKGKCFVLRVKRHQVYITSGLLILLSIIKQDKNKRKWIAPRFVHPSPTVVFSFFFRCPVFQTHPNCCKYRSSCIYLHIPSHIRPAYVGSVTEESGEFKVLTWEINLIIFVLV